MYTVGGHVADQIVGFLDQRRKETEAEIRRHRGPQHAQSRKVLRDVRDDYRDAIAGINTGDGVSRRDA